jgi:uncharacterized protein with beta-barrel porin domain
MAAETRKVLAAMGVLACAAAGAPAPACAQAYDLQGLLLLACSSGAAGALLTRCGETPGGSGDVSSQSEASLSPTQFLSGNAVAIERAKDRTHRIQQWLEDRRDAEAGRFRRLGAAAGEAAPEVPRLALLTNGRASWFDRSAGVQERGYDGTTHGALVGGDARLAPGAFLGGYVSYERTDSDFASDSGRLDADSASFGVFGSYNLTRAIYLDGSFGYGFTSYEVDRDAVFQPAAPAPAPATQVRTRAEPDGNELAASAALGYELQRESLTLGPYARATYVRSDIDGFAESDPSGSGLAMAVEGTARESLTTRVGASLSLVLETPLGALVPEGRFEWEHEFLQNDRNQTTTFALDTAANQLTLTGDAPDRSHLNLGAGLLLVLPGGWIPFLDYEGLVGDSELTQHRLSFGLRTEL